MGRLIKRGNQLQHLNKRREIFIHKWEMIIKNPRNLILKNWGPQFIPVLLKKLRKEVFFND